MPVSEFFFVTLQALTTKPKAKDLFGIFVIFFLVYISNLKGSQKLMALFAFVTVNERGERWINHYSSSHKILLVGEGDFSFSACLATAFGTAVNMVATSLDSEGIVILKHPSAIQNLEKLKASGCMIVHEVNACTMIQHPQLFQKLFDRIVFNFPHAGFSNFCSEHDDYQIQQHQNVVRGFLSNARKILTVNGEVHVTHKTAHPFSKWEIVKLAEEVGLRLVEEASFTKWDYPGYQNKRGDGNRSNQSFPVAACSTYKFSKQSADHGYIKENSDPDDLDYSWVLHFPNLNINLDCCLKKSRKYVEYVE